MGRIVVISSLAFLALAFLGIGLGMYFFLKRLVVNGKSVLDEPVNEQTRTDKMGLGELLVYLSMIALAGVFVVQIMSRGGTGNVILAKIVILPPIMALFNARKRTGKSDDRTCGFFYGGFISYDSLWSDRVATQSSRIDDR